MPPAGLCVDQVMTGKAARAFLAARPLGHHAESNKPMGFCLFSSAAIAANHARAAHGLTRVAVLDFDVHHGKFFKPFSSQFKVYQDFI